MGRTGVLPFLFVALAFATEARAQLAVTPTGDANVLADAILTDPGITITSATYSGAVSAAGTFTGGPLGILDGIVVTTGSASDALPPNDSPSTTTDHGGAGHALCDSLSGGFPTFDASYLRIDFTLEAGLEGIGLEFVFGSEEYPEFVGSPANDVLGIYLDGVNIGTDVMDNAITINGPFFSSGAVITDTATEYSGSTPLIRRAAAVTPAASHTLEIVVCDSGDGLYDSAVFLADMEGCVGNGCNIRNYCGDGAFLSPDEQCDDGNNVDGDGCNVDCTVTAGFECTGSTGETSVCAELDDCATGADNCSANATCTNMPGAGAFSCACNAGFSGDGVTCTDIDECATSADNCHSTAICTNAPGSFTCACSMGYAGDGITGCTDIDECATNADNCHSTAICTNTPGSFICACNAGFAGDGVTCMDIDECALGTDNCDANATCGNAPGGFVCACSVGYEGDGVTCEDVDECALGTDNCDANATCSNAPGGFACACKAGFEGDGVTCEDVDECATGSASCDANATCTNVASGGGFSCACNAGFAGDGVTCADIDECATGTDTCHENAACTNTMGGFTCACSAGYAGDGSSCSDVDECATGGANCDANATCSNVPGSFACACKAGYVGNGVECTAQPEPMPEPIQDGDEDGVPDAIDNCPLVANPDQSDENGNGPGDACEATMDADADGVPDDIDNCPFYSNRDQTDDDANGVGDLCEINRGGGSGCSVVPLGSRSRGSHASALSLLALLLAVLPLGATRRSRRRRCARTS